MTGCSVLLRMINVVSQSQPSCRLVEVREWACETKLSRHTWERISSNLKAKQMFSIKAIWTRKLSGTTKTSTRHYYVIIVFTWNKFFKGNFTKDLRLTPGKKNSNSSIRPRLLCPYHMITKIANGQTKQILQNMENTLLVCVGHAFTNDPLVFGVHTKRACV